MVDVRDVATAHVRALIGGTTGRFLVTGRSSSMSEIARIARNRFPFAKIPRPSPLLPKTVMFAAALVDRRLTFRFVRERVGAPSGNHSAARCQSVLGVPSIPLEQSVADACESFKRLGILPDLNTTTAESS